MSMAMRLFRISLLSVVFFSAVSNGDLKKFSNIRKVGDNQEALDISISLYRPQSEVAPGTALREQYEQVIGYLADAIYEMTNSGHMLGKVKIFTDYAFWDDVDIIWVSNRKPGASFDGFIGRGGQIIMSDTSLSNNYRIPGANVVRQEAGYVLAHECGHYIYSLDEEYGANQYAIEYPDGTPVPSIMNSPISGKNGNYEYLNFSTSEFDHVFAKSLQWLEYGVDSWTALTEGRTLGYTFDVLKQHKPTVSDKYTTTIKDTTYSRMKVELPTPRARDSLDIIWMENNSVIVDLVLDRSISMEGKPIEDVRAAAQIFLSIISGYCDDFDISPYIGITEFCRTPTIAHQITPFGNSSYYQLRSTISGLSVSGGTAMYDACTTSVNKLKSYPLNNAIRLSMLFTDGAENSSNETDVENVIAPFAANNIPIHAFGYGSGASFSNCSTLTAGTNGQFFAHLASSEDISDAWLKIFDGAADVHYVKDAVFSAPAGLDFTIDSTVSASVVEVRYTLEDTTSHCEFAIVDNDGMLVPSTTTPIPLGDSYPRDEIALISIGKSAVAGAKAGNWKCNVASLGLASTNLKGKVRIKGKSNGTYSATTGSHQKGFYAWPQPLRLSASAVGKGGAIIGLNLTATLTTPSGGVISVVLNDSGINGDKFAGDGIYSLDYSQYTENGQYTLSVQFDNGSGSAYYATGGACLPYTTHFGATAAADTVFVTENFTRVSSTVFHVSGVNAQPPTEAGSIMGFESDTLWHIMSGSGTLSSSVYRMEGKASLQISGNGWQQIKSSDINTEELSNVTNTLSVGLYMGDTQDNPYWTGQVQLFVSCPSANVYNQFIGFVDLTGLPLDQFSMLSFTLPQNIVDILNGSYSDFSFSLSINTNANTGAYYFDNMRFED